MYRTTMLITIEHRKPIPGLTDLVAQRAWNIDGVRAGETLQRGCYSPQADGIETPTDDPNKRAPGAVTARQLDEAEAADVQSVLDRHEAVRAVVLNPSDMYAG